MTRSGQAGEPAVGDLLGDLRGVLLEGRYRVDELIAQGGMSRVYSGLDTRLDRPVAIKVMDPRLAADPDFRRRFQREARAAARLDHPGVVDVHDQGTHGNGPAPLVFLVMELVGGGNLRDVLESRRALSVPEAFAVLEAVLAGLASAHRDGLVHRDVKPENVLISRTGAVKVADFGLVTAAASAGPTGAGATGVADGAGTCTGAILGTPAYLSPEQVGGQPTDARTDVYAAGILLYEMLTGAPPFAGDTAMAVAYQHVNGEVPPPSARAPGIPTAVDDLVALATARDPDARPIDAGDLALAVRRVRSELGLSMTAIPVPPPRGPVDGANAPMNGAVMSAGRGSTRQLTHAPAAQAAVLDAPAPRSARTRAPRPPLVEPVLRRRRSRRAFAIWLSVVLVLGVIVAATAWWLGAGRWTEMPSVVGLDRVSAERVLAEADLTASYTERSDDGIPAGSVIASDPAPAVQVPRGSGVTLTISTGRPEVPAIAAGTDVAEAQRLISAAGLTPTASDQAEFSASVTEGTVFRTDPAAGTRLASGSPVELVLSAGPQPPPAEERFPPGLGRILEDLGLGNDNSGPGNGNGNGRGRGRGGGGGDG